MSSKKKVCNSAVLMWLRG